MIELVQESWWAFVLALAIGIAVARWVFVVNRRARVEIKAFDALAEGAAPAQRNQALIDAPTRTSVAPTVASAAPVAGGDDLTRIKGLGPKIAALLNALGVTSFAQVAGWSEDDIDRIDAQLVGFEGRIRRDDWVRQASLLAEGDQAGFEDQFGKL